MKSILQDFGRSTSRVVIQEEVSTFGAHFAQILASAASGALPDVFVESGAYYYDHLDASLLLDLGPRATADRLDLARYWTEPITRVTGGQLYGTPLWCADELVFVNRDAIDRRGIPMPAADWSWSDFLTVASALTDGKPGEVRRWGTSFVNDIPGGWGSLVASNGGHWLDPRLRRTAFDAAAADALQWVVDAIHVHHVAPRPDEQQRITKAGERNPFLDEAVAILPNGTWEMPTVLAQARFRWDVLPFPRAPGTGQSVALANVQPGCAARTSQHPDECWQLLQHLLSPTAQTRWSTGKIRLPALRSVAADTRNGYAAPPPANAAFAARAMDTSRDLAFTPHWQRLRAAVVGSLEPAFAGRVPLTDAISAAVTAGDAILRG